MCIFHLVFTTTSLKYYPSYIKEEIKPKHSYRVEIRARFTLTKDGVTMLLPSLNNYQFLHAQYKKSLATR